MKKFKHKNNRFFKQDFFISKAASVKPKTKNFKPKIENLISLFTNRLRKQSQVEGVILLGGLGRRNFLDKHSDVDFAVFVNPRFPLPFFIKKTPGFLLPKWLPRFEFYVRSIVGDLEFNLHQQVLRDEAKLDHPWDETKKEAYSRGIIILDRSGKLKRLLTKKLSFPEKWRQRRLTEIVGQFPWYAFINPLRQIDRGFIHNGHDLLNQAIEMLVEALFLYNRQYRPHKKWCLETSMLLPWLPKGYRRNILEAMLIKDFSGRDIYRRVRILKKIFESLQKCLLKEKVVPKNAYEYACIHFWGRQLLEKPFSVQVLEKLDNIGPSPDKKNLNLLANFIDQHLICTKKELLNEFGTFVQEELNRVPSGETKKLFDLIERCL